jgi:hypothetical protein
MRGGVKTMAKKKKETPKEPTKKIPLMEWLEEGESLFGKDRIKWRFKCSICGNTQTGEEMIKFMSKEEVDSRVHFSCIGRWDDTQGCDYTLGGLFVIPGVYVLKDEKEIPVFSFSKEECKVKHRKAF